MSRILIVDDTSEVRKLIVEVLNVGNFETMEASNGADGLVLAEKNTFDLIICDIMMPEMDGYAFLSRLRERPENLTLPVIFLTAKADHKDVRKGMNVGADDYITKPFSTAELLETVRARVDRKNQVVQQMADAGGPGTVAVADMTAALKSEYGMTEQESLICTELYTGTSRVDLEKKLSIKASTLKIHLNSIYKKTIERNSSESSGRRDKLQRLTSFLYKLEV